MGNALKDLYGRTSSGAAWFQFENAWRKGMIPNLWEAIAATEPARRQELAAEFAMIDLEWRWRHNIYDEPRDVAHYIRLLQPLALRPERLLALVEHAFIVRSQWGDSPTVDAMMDGLPAIDSLRAVLQRALMENFPAFVSVRKAGRIVLEDVLGHVSQLGQQCHDEPAPFSVDEQSNVKRFIIAGADDEHFPPVAVEVTRASAHSAEIQHFAPKLHVSIDKKPLITGESRRCMLPFTMAIDDFSLRIARCD